MMIKKIILVAIFILPFLIISGYLYSQTDTTSLPKLIIFHSPSCHKCTEVKNKLMPDIEKDFKGLIEVEYRDISKMENYMFLLNLEEKHHVEIEIDLPVFYLAGNFLNGKGQIQNKLHNFIAKALKRSAKCEPLPTVDLVRRFRGFTPLAIISAGLIDGINPCAFTVIVFFISFLSLQGYKKKELIVIGLSFIFAVCLTYILIGLGLFGFLYRLEKFWLVTRIFNFSIGIFSVILGILATYDFFKFKKTKETEGLVLQLPAAIKNRIHYIIGLHYRKTKGGSSATIQLEKHIFRLVLSALVTGFLVSILEAVCTGQTYLPTISFILKTTPLKLPALGYLLLYNLMFIVPLLFIFLFALLGVTSEQFSDFLKRHLLTVKILMAILFFGLGFFLIWRA